MEADTEYKNLPIDEKVVHKQWKVRLEGYTECAKYFATITDPKSMEFQKFAGLMKKFVTDSNAVALDKALDAVLVYVQEAHIAGKTASEATSGIITKCLAAPKKSTQDKALDILLMYCEIERQEAVQEELLKGFGQKNPKVVTGCVRSITAALREFGNKVILIKPLVKTIGPLLEDRDKNVRDEAKKMVVEMYRWVREALKPQLTSLKPIQVTELEAEFEKLGSERATPIRLLKSQQEKAEREQAAPTEHGEEEAEEVAEKEIDPLDLMDAVPVLEKLPKDFFEQMDAKKWQDRKEGLSALLPLVQSPKIESGDYGDLVRTLKKVIGKDSNVMLVALAGQCLTGLAKGLRMKFSPYAVSCLETVLAKFKEKKTNVLAAMREASDAIFQSTNVDSIQEMAITSLNTKNPTVKSETASFLARSFCYCTPTILTKKLLKTYTIELLKVLNDPDPTVRDSAAEALGTAMRVVGEKGIEPFIADVDAIKKTKIKEYCEKADIKVKIVVPKAASKPKPAPSKAIRGRGGVARKRPPSPLPDDEEDTPQLSPENSFTDQPPKTTTVKPRGASARGGTAKRGGRAAAAPKPPTPAAKEPMDNLPLLQVNSSKQQRSKDEQRLRVLRWDFVTPRAEFITQLKDQMEFANVQDQLMSNMFHQDFKFHIKALDSLQKDLITNKEACVANLDLILRWLTIRFFDTNPSVIMKAMDYLKQVFTLLSEDQYKLLDHEAYSFLPFLVMKYGDSKDTIRTPAQNITSLICHIYPSSKISPFILEGLKSKNARQRVVCLETMSAMIGKVGMSVCQPNVGAALKDIAKQIGDRDNTVRNAALNALVQVYYREGEKVYKMIGTLAEKDRSLLEERIRRTPKKAVVKKSPQPEPSVAVVRPSASESSIVPPSTGTRIGRVVPTAAQPAPFVRNARVLPPDTNVNRRMQIDYEQFEKLLDDGQPMPNNRQRLQLEEVEDLEAIMQDDIELPARLSKLTKPGFGFSPKSTMTPQNINNEDASDAISSVISDINAPEISQVVLALSQLDELIASDDKRVHLYAHIDKLLNAITHQYTYVFNIKMADEVLKKQDCIRIYRSLTNCLISIFDNKDLGVLASRDRLHYTIHSILSILLDTRLSELEDGPKVIRTLNVLVVRMIEKANFTHVFCALLKLLRESVGKGLNSKFTELVMKCNWKAIRILPSKSADLNVVHVLDQVHQFMQAYPSATWTDKPSNTPLRTIKTVMHDLVQIYGNAIFNHLAKVPNSQGSELQKYIMKSINAQKSSNGHTTEVLPSNEESKPKKKNKATSSTLSEIFQTIGTKENTQKGLSQLYEFKLKHPEADIEPYLKKSSQFFQNYIERGLKKVEMEKRQDVKTKSTAPTDSSANAGPLGSIQPKDIANSNVNELVDQFKAIATEAGFDHTYIESAVKDIYSGIGQLDTEATSPVSK